MNNTNTINKIIDGLFASINESATFNNKLDSFLAWNGIVKGSDQYKFIYNFVSTMCIELNNKFGGYIENKTVRKKRIGNHTVFSWKVQAREKISDGIRNGKVAKYPNSNSGLSNFITFCFDKTGGTHHSIKIDGNEYGISILGLSNIDDYLQDYQKYERELMIRRNINKQFDIDKNVLVGVSESTFYEDSKPLDASYKGEVISLIISVPIPNQQEIANDYMTKKYGEYSFANDNDFSVRFDAEANEFVTYSGQSNDTFCVIYKKGRNARKVFDTLVQTFDNSTTLEDVEQLLRANNIQIATSYYPSMI